MNRAEKRFCEKKVYIQILFEIHQVIHTYLQELFTNKREKLLMFSDGRKLGVINRRGKKLL